MYIYINIINHHSLAMLSCPVALLSVFFPLPFRGPVRVPLPVPVLPASSLLFLFAAAPFSFTVVPLYFPVRALGLRLPMPPRCLLPPVLPLFAYSPVLRVCPVRGLRVPFPGPSAVAASCPCSGCRVPCLPGLSSPVNIQSVLLLSDEVSLSLFNTLLRSLKKKKLNYTKVR